MYEFTQNQSGAAKEMVFGLFEDKLLKLLPHYDTYAAMN